jgi:hypothetical protein
VPNWNELEACCKEYDDQRYSMNFEDLSKPCRYTGMWMFEILYGKKSVPDLDKERP